MRSGSADTMRSMGSPGISPMRAYTTTDMTPRTQRRLPQPAEDERGHAFRPDAQGDAASGFTILTSGKRMKSRSVVAMDAPCSMASAARCASITMAPFA